MATSYLNRRACTELPDPTSAPFDFDNLPDDENKPVPDNDELDDIDFQNYKGIYAQEDNNQKYQCPETGAHFEFNNLCQRLSRVL